MKRMMKFLPSFHTLFVQMLAEFTVDGVVS
jgi:hypothetical protein